MDFRQLSYFVRIVDAGSLRRASGVLGIAQPALSYQLHRPEAELGAALLVRSARGVRPTEAGLLVYRQARAVLRQLEQLPSALDAARSDPVGEVVVGLPSLLGGLIGASLAIAVRDRFRQVRLRVVEGESILQRELVTNSRVELAIVYEHKEAPELIRRPLYRQSLYLLTQGAGEGPAVALAEAAGLPLVLPLPPNPVRTIVDEAIGRIGLQGIVTAELNSIPMLLAAVRSGLGCVIIPWTPLIEDPGYPITFRRIVEPPISLQVSLCTSNLLPTSGAALAVQEVLATLILDRIARPDWRGAERAI